MKILTLQLAAALALLFFPRFWMRRGVALLRRRGRSGGSERIRDPWKDGEPGDPRVDPRKEFAKVRNYLDLLRAAAGGVAIWGAPGLAPALAADPEAGGRGALRVLAIQGGLTVLAVLVQAVRYEKLRLSFFPPVFFLAGLSVAASGYRAAAFAFVAIWAFNAGIANAQGFLAVYALLLLGFGLLFNGWSSVPAATMAVAAFLPMLLSLLARRPLVIFTRKGSRGR